MTELVVGTKKGLFLLEGEADGGSADRFEIGTRAFAGQPVDYAMRDPRSGRLFAAVTSPFYGPKLFYTDGDPGSDWEQAEGVALPGGRGPGARAHLGDRCRRGAGNAVHGRRSRRAVREP